MVKIYSDNVHFEDGEIGAGVVEVNSNEPLIVKKGKDNSYEMKFENGEHIAPALADSHIHARHSYKPTKDEFAYSFDEREYNEIITAIENERNGYTLNSAIKSALVGGSWIIGCQGNTQFSPIGEAIWRKTQKDYNSYSHYIDFVTKKAIYIHVYPRVKLGAKKILGQSEKDFESGPTFGSSNRSYEDEVEIYEDHNAGDLRFHNAKGRDISIEDFNKLNSLGWAKYTLHDRYHNVNELVIPVQKRIIALARKYKLKRINVMHIPTGSALEHILSERGMGGDLEIIPEIGADYLLTSIQDKLEQDESIREINYRLPAHPSNEEQLKLITLLKETLEAGNNDLILGSDHAPHPLKNKLWTNGIPNSPGTRCTEHLTQIMQNLIENYDFSYQIIDQLAINTAKHIANYFTASGMEIPFPIGGIKDGNMANIRVFNPNKSYDVNENRMKELLSDKEYHSGYKKRQLRGQNIFTIVNGTIFNVSCDRINQLN